MSATGRSAVRRVDDFYETPAWVTQALLATGDVSTRFCDPCAGKGAILHAARAFSPRYVPWGIELNEEYSREDSAIVCADFLQIDLTPRFTHQDIVMNPPYRQAQSFVLRALHVLLAAQDSTHMTAAKVHALLRLSFLESKERSPFLRANMPSKVRVLSKRPSFTGKGTDACAYAWFTWNRSGAHPTLLELL